MRPRADLFEMLACPVCRGGVDREHERLRCAGCGAVYPVVGGVPVMFPDARQPERPSVLPQTQDTYWPWVHRVVLQSLLDDSPVLEIGSGNMALDDPCVVRMDVQLTPHVDVVGDVHALPFRDDVFDFVFSLAVFEHLRQPFEGAEEIRRVVRDGGYVYHECNFVYPYHGFPHHYFNATVQGLERLLSGFRKLRSGVAPYQMPSFALRMLIFEYLHHSTAGLSLSNRPFVDMLQRVHDADLLEYDRCFTEDGAANLAAGVFFFGVKQGQAGSTVVPQVVLEQWRGSAELQRRMPEPLDLGRADNLLLWARGEGAVVPEVRRHLDEIVPFDKRGVAGAHGRAAIRALPVVEPRFGCAYDYPDVCPRPPHGAGWRMRAQRVLRRWADRFEREAQAQAQARRDRG